MQSALASGSAVYAAVGTQGAVVLDSAAPSVGPVIQVIKKTTMPDGTDAFQLQVLSILSGIDSHHDERVALDVSRRLVCSIGNSSYTFHL